MNLKKKISKAAVVLGFYNGNEYIKEQIYSILNQSYQNFDLFIFDDNSSQNFSLKTLNLDKQNIKKIKVKKRRINLGYAKNFLFALKSIGNN